MVPCFKFGCTYILYACTPGITFHRYVIILYISLSDIHGHKNILKCSFSEKATS